MVTSRYRGINPHLNSILQSPGGGWQMFHARCIEKLSDALESVLPANYYVATEKSLQVTVVEPDTPSSHPPTTSQARPRATRPDALILQSERDVSTQQAATSRGFDTPTLTFAATPELTDDKDILSVVVYRLHTGEFPGLPIVRLELLSPSNKPPHSGYTAYRFNRQRSLNSGLCLVEVDWLHETRPVWQTIPSYADHEAGSYAYNITLTNPRPTLADARTEFYGFGVDDPLPVIRIPLADDDDTILDFNQVYVATVSNRRAFALLVDYTQEPVRMHTYSPRDQAIIRQRMADQTP